MKNLAMRRQLIQPQRERTDGHRALPRCRRCGADTLAGSVIDGALLCERCTQRARQDRDETDRTEVNFLL